MRGDLKQHGKLEKFCTDRTYEPHKTLQLFRRSEHEPWVLYRRGTKGSQRMRSGRAFPGWTFSKSLGNEEERRLYKCVCLDGVAHDGVEEQILYAKKSTFEKCVNGIKAKRLYIARDFDHIFDPHRRDLVQKLKPTPIFDE